MTRTLRRASRWTRWSVLGPTFLLKAKHQPKDFDRRIIVEMWLYPDGSRILEVSTKCLPDEAFQVGAKFKAYLAKLRHRARRTAGDEDQGRAGVLQGQSQVRSGWCCTGDDAMRSGWAIGSL